MIAVDVAARGEHVGAMLLVHVTVVGGGDVEGTRGDEAHAVALQLVKGTQGPLTGAAQ